MRCRYCYRVVHAPNGLWKTKDGRWLCYASPDQHRAVW
jgi:hypothetical protein